MSWMKRIGVVCTLALLAVGIGATAASANPQPDTALGQLFNHANTSNCLLMRTSAAPIVYPCMNYLDQEWVLRPALDFGPDSYTIQNDNPSDVGCLQAAATNTAGLQLVHAPCAEFNSPNHEPTFQQVWVFQQVTLPGDASGAGWQIQSRIYSGLCILGQYGATNMAITQYPCMAYPDQVWGQRHSTT